MWAIPGRTGVWAKKINEVEAEQARKKVEDEDDEDHDDSSVIEEVDRRELEYLIKENDLVAVFFCMYLSLGLRIL